MWNMWFFYTLKSLTFHELMAFSDGQVTRHLHPSVKWKGPQKPPLMRPKAPSSWTKNTDSFGALLFHLVALSHLSGVLVQQEETESEGTRENAKEKEKRKVQGQRRVLKPNHGCARQLSSGWALWGILPIFHAHPSWCDPTQGLLCPWQLCAGKHAAALIA